MTTENSNNNIVHESETQRRHSRVKIPSSLVLTDKEGNEQRFPILDLSATGFAFSGKELGMSVGDFNEGILLFKFDALEIGLNIKFQIVGIHGEDNPRYGCEFHELGREEVATLRTIITKFLSGEVTNINDILSTLSRDNFAKQRQDEVSKALTGREKFRALLFTFAFVVLSLLAFSYVVYSIHQKFFVLQANSAVIKADSSGVSASRNGEIDVLVVPGQQVSQGQPLAVVKSPLLSDMSNVASAANMQQDDLNQLLDRTISSNILSPCDCTIMNVSAGDGEYVQQGQTIFELSGSGVQARVYARFDYAKLSDISIGTQVQIGLADGTTTLDGTIVNLRMPENIASEEHKVHAILATIETESPLAMSLVNQPVSVSVGEISVE
jgi:alginate biosynthesis protein Alg44